MSWASSRELAVRPPTPGPRALPPRPRFSGNARPGAGHAEAPSRATGCGPARACFAGDSLGPRGPKTSQSGASRAVVAGTASSPLTSLIPPFRDQRVTHTRCLTSVTVTGTGGRHVLPEDGPGDEPARPRAAAPHAGRHLASRKSRRPRRGRPAQDPDTDRPAAVPERRRTQPRAREGAARPAVSSGTSFRAYERRARHGVGLLRAGDRACVFES